MKVGVLGVSGMLGRTVYRHFKDMGLDVVGTTRQKKDQALYLNLDDGDYLQNLIDFIKKERPQIIINGIASTHVTESSAPSIKKAMFVNGVFPQVLDELAVHHSFKIINTSTDAVFQNSRGEVDETAKPDGLSGYAQSKILGEVTDGATLNVRTSIVGLDGPEAQFKHLLSWFLAHDDDEEVMGYVNHLWVGVTTLQLAQYYAHLITADLLDKVIENSNVIHFVPNEPLSKFELLKLINEKFKRKIKVLPKEATESVNRKLISKWPPSYPPRFQRTLAAALEEMHHLYI